jgi:hypothetical protein
MFVNIRRDILWPQFHRQVRVVVTHHDTSNSRKSVFVDYMFMVIASFMRVSNLEGMRWAEHSVSKIVTSKNQICHYICLRIVEGMKDTHLVWNSLMEIYLLDWSFRQIVM